MRQGARFGALSTYLRRDFQVIPSDRRVANVPIGKLIRTFETTSPIRRSPHQCPASRLFVESTRAPHQYVWDLHVRRRGVNDSMRIVAGAVRRTRGVRRRKMEPFNSIVDGASFGRAEKSPGRSKTQVKEHGTPKKIASTCRSATPSLTGRAATQVLSRCGKPRLRA